MDESGWCMRDGSISSRIYGSCIKEGGGDGISGDYGGVGIFMFSGEVGGET